MSEVSPQRSTTISHRPSSAGGGEGETEELCPAPSVRIMCSPGGVEVVACHSQCHPLEWPSTRGENKPTVEFLLVNEGGKAPGHQTAVSSVYSVSMRATTPEQLVFKHSKDGREQKRLLDNGGRLNSAVLE